MPLDEVPAAQFMQFIEDNLDDSGFVLNGVRIDSNNRAKLKRWRERDTISIYKVDEFLVAHDLLLVEFEDWLEAAILGSQVG